MSLSVAPVLLVKALAGATSLELVPKCDLRGGFISLGIGAGPE